MRSLSAVLRSPAALLTLVSVLLLAVALGAFSPWVETTPDFARLADAAGIEVPAQLAQFDLPAEFTETIQARLVASGIDLGLLQAPPVWAQGLLVGAALLGAAAVLLAVFRPQHASDARGIALLGGLLGVGYFAYFLRLQGAFDVDRLLNGVTTGFWIALAGTVGLIVQGAFTATQRSGDSYTVRVDTAAISGRASGSVPSLNVRQNLRVAFDALLNNKLRAALTMLGIVIGVGSVVALLSIGQGTQDSVTESIQGIGTNTLTISPLGRPNRLTEADAAAIAAEISGISEVVPQFNGTLTVIAGENTLTTQVSGVAENHFVARGLEVQTGRPFDAVDMEDNARVAVLGTSATEDLFGDVNPVGETIRIGSQRFEVIGVLEQQDSGLGQDPNASILIPLTAGYRYLYSANAVASSDRLVSVITVVVTETEQVDAVMDQVEALLRSRHELTLADDLDFRVFNQQQLLETLSSVTETFTFMLAAIAGVSLVVGGIGVMNITLVSVTERTREIGLRKAIGAKNYHIMQQFLFETLVLSVAGGLVGIISGVSIALAINATGLLTATITFEAIALGLSSSIITGIFFGVYPASRAAALAPIEALRYE